MKYTKNLMLKNKWINPMHTKVPGSDGLLSYGGYCFPKDTNALAQYMRREGITCKVLEGTIQERNEMRDDNVNVKLKNNTGYVAGFDTETEDVTEVTTSYNRINMPNYMKYYVPTLLCGTMVTLFYLYVKRR